MKLFLYASGVMYTSLVGTVPTEALAGRLEAQTLTALHSAEGRWQTVELHPHFLNSGIHRKCCLVHNLYISLLSHPRPLELRPLYPQSSAQCICTKSCSELRHMYECRCSPIIDGPASLTLSRVPCFN